MLSIRKGIVEPAVMANPAGESNGEALRLDFDWRSTLSTGKGGHTYTPAFADGTDGCVISRKGGRFKKTTIVALARKLPGALWKYVAAGVVTS